MAARAGRSFLRDHADLPTLGGCDLLRMAQRLRTFFAIGNCQCEPANRAGFRPHNHARAFPTPQLNNGGDESDATGNMAAADDFWQPPQIALKRHGGLQCAQH